MTCCPFVYWAQNVDEVYLTVDLRDSSNVKLSVRDNLVGFRAIGSGAQGRKEYAFSLPLFANVQLSKAAEEGGSCLRYVLKKDSSKWWPAVTKDQGRISWLRVDFDRFKDPDESDHSNDDFEMVDADQQDYDAKVSELAKKILDGHKEKPKPFGDAVKLLEDVQSFTKRLLSYYLVGYNVILLSIHFYVLVSLLSNYIVRGPDYFKSFWAKDSYLVMLATRLQLCDVVHSLAGITKTGIFASLMQVLGRLTILHVIDGYVELHSATSTYCLMVVYFLIEIVRYPYYAVSCMKKEFRITTWLRYNMWIPLYPAGFLLEAITLVRAIPFYYDSGTYSISMPNSANIAFNFGMFLVALLVLLPIIGVYLMLYMCRQRSKKYIDVEKKVR